MTSVAHDQTLTKTVLHFSRFQILSKGHAVWLLGTEGLTAQDLGIGERKLVSSRICVWAIYLPVNVVQSNYGLPFQFYSFYLLALSWQCCQMCSNHVNYDLAKHLIWIVSNVVKSGSREYMLCSWPQSSKFLSLAHHYWRTSCISPERCCSLLLVSNFYHQIQTGQPFWFSAGRLAYSSLISCGQGNSKGMNFWWVMMLSTNLQLQFLLHQFLPL